MTGIPKMGTYYILRKTIDGIVTHAWGFATREEAQAFDPSYTE